MPDATPKSMVLKRPFVASVGLSADPGCRSRPTIRRGLVAKLEE